MLDPALLEAVGALSGPEMISLARDGVLASRLENDPELASIGAAGMFDDTLDTSLIYWQPAESTVDVAGIPLPPLTAGVIAAATSNGNKVALALAGNGGAEDISGRDVAEMMVFMQHGREAIFAAKSGVLMDLALVYGAADYPLAFTDIVDQHRDAVSPLRWLRPSHDAMPPPDDAFKYDWMWAVRVASGAAEILRERTEDVIWTTPLRRTMLAFVLACERGGTMTRRPRRDEALLDRTVRIIKDRARELFGDKTEVTNG